MATTTKKGSESKKTKLRRGLMRTSPIEEAKANAELRQQLAECMQRQNALAKELQDCNRQLTEALEQQTATNEILRVIASSPTDIQPLLDVVAENAARLCDATDAAIICVDGASLKMVAHYGPLAASRNPPFDRTSIPGRAIIDRQTIHIHDLTKVPEDDLRSRFARSIGVRTVLVTPLLCEGTRLPGEGVPLGVIGLRRDEVRPFTEKQIKLLETFASQAVIAIENVRLFTELGARAKGAKQ
jgi:GAF domain-containing protein